MANVRCTTAEEVYEAIKYGNIPEICGDFLMDLEDSCDIEVCEDSPVMHVTSNSNIRVRGTSSPLIIVMGSCSPNLVLLGRSRPTIDIYDRCAPRVLSGEKSTTIIKTCNSSQTFIGTYDTSKVRISTFNSSDFYAHVYTDSILTAWLYGLNDPTINAMGSIPPVIERRKLNGAPRASSLDALLSDEVF